MYNKFSSIWLLGIVLMLFSSCQETTKSKPNKQENEKNTMKENNTVEAKAPVAEKQPKKLVAHGDTRVDDYFWMRLSDEQKTAEKPDAQTQKVLDFLNGENDFTEAKLKHTEDFQQKLYDEIVGRIKKDDASVPYQSNGYFYYTKYEKGKEYPIHCRKKGSLDGKEEILLDVNKMAEGQEYYQVSGLSVSPDNKILAFGVDNVSRRIYTIMFKNLETGELLPNEIAGTTGGGAWGNDNQTYFYTSRNEVTLLSEQIYRHDLKDARSELVYEEKDNTYYIGVYKSKSNKNIIIWNSSTLSSDYWILDADKPKGKFKNFSPRESDHEYHVYHKDDKFYILTNWKAKNFRLMEVSDKKTKKSNWKEVIAHREDVLLESVELFKDYMVVGERQKGNNLLRIINQKDKTEHYIKFDEEAYTADISVNKEFNTNLLRFGYSSMTTPYSTYDYDMGTKKRELKKRQEVVGGHNPDEYETKRLYAPARDGKQIPISIVYKKGFEPNGKAPLLLYSYGSYGSTIDPYFSSVRLSLLDRGFAYAIAHIRGGQFLGRAWYDDGKMLNKINTFNDYIDCGKYLVSKNYTSNDGLFAMGGSAGGLLMGAVANMAPDLFKGMVAAVPFVDVVSTMSDPTIPLTTNEYDEWGNPADKEYYEYMKKYSPYDNVAALNYPNILITTGYFDSQVQYWEPAKWIAKLREYKKGDNVLLMHTNMSAGHGGASGRFQRYKEVALEYAFIFDLVGIKE
ncbi:MAG: S9 family peptidase [Aureispira sp.]|nr:S9 family peptidase [Aureispira sp.]